MNLLNTSKDILAIDWSNAALASSLIFYLFSNHSYTEGALVLE